MSRATPRLLPVIVTRRFERALGRLLDHYESVRHLHADAGVRTSDIGKSCGDPSRLDDQPEALNRECDKRVRSHEPLAHVRHVGAGIWSLYGLTRGSKPHAKIVWFFSRLL